MKTIYKYNVSSLLTVGTNTDIIPLAAEIRKVAIQGGELMVWAEVDPNLQIEEYKKLVNYGTGHNIAPNSVYLGTIFVGQYVWHIHELN